MAVFKVLIVLCHLELLTSAEKWQKQPTYYFTLKVSESSCTYIMSPAEASV